MLGGQEGAPEGTMTLFIPPEKGSRAPGQTALLVPGNLEKCPGLGQANRRHPCWPDSSHHPSHPLSRLLQPQCLECHP